MSQTEKLREEVREWLNESHFQWNFLSDSKRISAATRNPQESEKLTGFLDKLGAVYSHEKWYPGYVYDSTFIIYQNADKRLLELRAQPSEGNVQVLQGEYAVTHSGDQNPILSTQALASCAGVLLYDPEVKAGAIAHIDYAFETPETIEEMIRKLGTLGAKNFVFGKTGNVEFVSGITKKYGDRFKRELELPRAFSFDTRDGKLYPFMEAEDPTLEKRLSRISHRLDENVTPTFLTYYPSTRVLA